MASGELLDAVWRAHPAAGRPGGPKREALEVAFAAMAPWKFAHEYGNRWQTAADVRLLPADKWNLCRYPDPLAEGRPAFAVDIPPDRSEGYIAAVVDRVAELVDVVPATRVPSRLDELVERWDPVAVALDGTAPAATVADRMRDRLGDRLMVASLRDLSTACGELYDDVMAGEARIRPSSTFDDAAVNARRRPVGQVWVWSRVDGGSPLIALSLALWAARQSAARPAPQDWMAF